MQKPKLNKVKYSFPEALLILAVSAFAALAGSLIGLLIDCFILNIDGTVNIIEVWSELHYTKIISLFSFFGTMLYFHYDNFKINWQRKKDYKIQLKEYNNYMSYIEKESMEEFVSDCRKIR
ncbi:sulfurtransferase [Salmonella enterica subsp. enterica serovar Braenderup]|nr:sulfurtransferase [Salmonella enterica subsp. enterica serovar Braenderup]